MVLLVWKNIKNSPTITTVLFDSFMEAPQKQDLMQKIYLFKQLNYFLFNGFSFPVIKCPKNITGIFPLSISSYVSFLGFLFEFCKS